MVIFSLQGFLVTRISSHKDFPEQGFPLPLPLLRRKLAWPSRPQDGLAGGRRPKGASSPNIHFRPKVVSYGNYFAIFLLSYFPTLLFFNFPTLLFFNFSTLLLFYSSTLLLYYTGKLAGRVAGGLAEQHAK